VPSGADLPVVTDDDIHDASHVLAGAAADAFTEAETSRSSITTAGVPLLGLKGLARFRTIQTSPRDLLTRQW
jgi:hypothetical protein